jgi:hypothetical protein
VARAAATVAVAVPPPPKTSIRSAAMPASSDAFVRDCPNVDSVLSPVSSSGVDQLATRRKGKLVGDTCHKSHSKADRIDCFLDEIEN